MCVISDVINETGSWTGPIPTYREQQCYPMYTRQTLLSTDQQIAGHGFSVNHNWLYDAAIVCLVQIAAVCADWICI